MTIREKKCAEYLLLIFVCSRFSFPMPLGHRENAPVDSIRELSTLQSPQHWCVSERGVLDQGSPTPRSLHLSPFRPREGTGACAFARSSLFNSSNNTVCCQNFTWYETETNRGLTQDTRKKNHVVCCQKTVMNKDKIKNHLHRKLKSY